MKAQPYIPIAAQLALILVLLTAAPSSVWAAEQTNSVAEPKAPTGEYVTAAEIVPAMTMRIEADGTFRVSVGPCGPAGCSSQEGSWRWDSARQEFILSPKVQLYYFNFRRFRVSKREPDTLEWLTVTGTGNVLGVYERISFKRQPGIGRLH